MGDSVPSVSILGVKVHDVTMPEALDRVSDFIASRAPHLIVTLGTEMVMGARRDRSLLNLVNGAALVIPDGGGLIWASRRFGTPLREKVAGIDFLQEICRLSGDRGWKLFFVGGKPGIAAAAAEKIRSRFPGAIIVGTHDGYTGVDEMLPALQEAKPDVVFAGMGFPRQERWLLELMSAAPPIPVGVGVGGSFDVLAGKLQRAPAWMIRLNLEWLFRFFQEPKRFRRIFNIPAFMLQTYLGMVTRKPQAGRHSKTI